MSEHRPDHTPDPDPALDRLRAADPAAGLEPDLDAIGAAVRARLDADHRPAVLGGPTRLGADRPARRTRRWPALAAVAAGTLLVGSAGYALGDRSGDGGSGPATVAMTGSPGPAARDSTVPDSASSAAAGGAAPEAADALLAPWFGGRTVFRAEGLPAEPGVAEAWGYDAAQVFGPQTASLVASSLGLDGEPRLEGATWTVGPADGSGPSLQLQPDGLASVSYHDPTRDPFLCAEHRAAVGEPEGGDTGAAVPVAPAPDCAAVDAAVALQGDAAVAQAREVVAGAGGDPDAFAYEVHDTGVGSAAHVTAHGIIGGQRTGNVWSMTLVGEEVQSLYGTLAPLVPLGTYDVVSAVEAVDRLTDPRFGATAGGPVMAAGGGMPEPALEPDGAVAGGGAGNGAGPPAAAAPGSAFAWPVTEVALTGARLGLTQHTQPDGSTVVLPAYELSSDDGATWTVVAVAGSGLDFDA